MQRISSCYIISFERLFAFFRARRAGRLRVSRRSALHSKLGLPCFSNKKASLMRCFNLKNWQWPSFPARFQASIFGAKGLYFCVRDENRCYSFAKITSNGWMNFNKYIHNYIFIKMLTIIRICLLNYDYHLFIWSSPLPISITQLHALLHFHLWPINLVFCKGYY